MIRKKRGKRHLLITKERGYNIKECPLPMESLTATNWPFFLVQMYLPLLAFSATLWPSHSTENMVFADLWWKRFHTFLKFGVLDNV